MPELPDECVQLAISFPPFLHVRNASHLNKRLLLSMLRPVHKEMFRVLSPDGFLVSVNTDVRDRPLYNDESSTSSNIWWKHQAIRELAEQSGFHCLGTKIWVKTLKRSLYRFSYSYVVFYGKGRRSLSVSGNECPDFKLDVWLLEGQTSFRLPNGRLFRDSLHPVVAERCIRQLSHVGDRVLAPFAGVGTIPIAADRLKRRWNGYEIDPRLRTTLISRLGRQAVR
jgi:DNA modification methylase